MYSREARGVFFSGLGTHPLQPGGPGEPASRAQSPRPPTRPPLPSYPPAPFRQPVLSSRSPFGPLELLAAPPCPLQAQPCLEGALGISLAAPPDLRPHFLGLPQAHTHPSPLGQSIKSSPFLTPWRQTRPHGAQPGLRPGTCRSSVWRSADQPDPRKPPGSPRMACWGVPAPSTRGASKRTPHCLSEHDLTLPEA